MLASLTPPEASEAPQPEAVVDSAAAPTPSAPAITDATDGAGQVDPELAAVFQEEAREAAEALKVHLQALAGNLQDRTAAGVAERVYHTLKGASATVGFSGISRVAAHLQDLLGSIAEGAQLLTAELLTRIVADTNRMMQLVGLPELTIGTGGSASVPASLEEFSSGTRCRTRRCRSLRWAPNRHPSRSVTSSRSEKKLPSPRPWRGWTRS